MLPDDRWHHQSGESTLCTLLNKHSKMLHSILKTVLIAQIPRAQKVLIPRLRL
jgi:hypothetical protein